jgi:hypothetical protein
MYANAGEKTKSEFKAVKQSREVLTEGRHVESSPRKHRGLHRVDVDVCECGGVPIGAIGSASSMVRSKLEVQPGTRGEASEHGN